MAGKAGIAVKKKEETIDIIEVSQGRIDFCVLGKTPFICHAMGKKVREELLLPSPRKNAAQKAANLKHNPPEEYRDSIYRAMTDDSPTRILTPAMMFKAAMASVAIDIPGAAKAQIGRLTYVNGDYINLYGIPQIYIKPMRMADINRTPDMRTRAIMPEWACNISVTFVKPIMKETPVANLLAAAGIMRGVGDSRVEKGKGNFGQFELVSADNKDFKRILKAGLKEQDEALKNPKPYDAETADLLTWWEAEAKRRGFKIAG